MPAPPLESEPAIVNAVLVRNVVGIGGGPRAGSACTGRLWTLDVERRTLNVHSERRGWRDSLRTSNIQRPRLNVQGKSPDGIQPSCAESTGRNLSATVMA